MKVERYTVQACCGKKSLILKTDKPLDRALISFLVANGFTERTHFTAAGILYTDNSELIVSGPLGSDKLQVKCKKGSCEQDLNNFELLIKQLE